MNNALSVLERDCEVTTLPNGLRVASLYLPQIESVSINLFVDVGARYEAQAVNGIAHLLEHMAFKGTRRRSALDIAVEFDAIGGNLNAYTSMEHTVYYAKILKEHAPLAVDVLADITQHSVFDAEELERERLVVLQEIAMHYDTPDDVVFDMFTEAAWPGQALGRSILGPAEQVEKYGKGELDDYVAAHYQAPRMVLAAAGNIQHSELVKLAEEHFSSLASGKGQQAEKAGYKGGELRKEKELEQVHLVLGFPAVHYRHKDYRATQLLATVLGGGMSSRLFQEVREKRGLAYSIYAFVNAYADDGLFSVYTGTGEKQAGEVVDIIVDTLKKAVESLSEDELQRARNQYKAGIIMAQESSSSLSESLGRNLLMHGRYRTPQEIVAEIEAVTLADLRRMLESALGQVPSLAAIGPLGKVPGYDKVRQSLQ